MFCDCVFSIKAPARAVVVFDQSQRISASIEAPPIDYLATGRIHRFEQHTAAEVRCHLEALQAGDLAILVQSTNFVWMHIASVSNYLKQGLKVIEHLHLGRMAGKKR